MARFWFDSTYTVYVLCMLAVQQVFSEEEIQTDEEIYKCFTSVNCNYDYGRDKVMDCVQAMRTTEKEEVLTIGNNSAPTNYGKYFTMYDDYCLLSDEEKTEVFTVYAQQFIEKYSEVCVSAKEEDKCNEYKKLFECVFSMMDDFEEKGLC